MLHTGFHIQQCNFILRKGQMSNKLLQNAVHGTGTALIGFVNLSAGHEFYSVFFTVIFLWDICHGEIFGEKLLGKGRKLHSVQNTRGHHGFEGFKWCKTTITKILTLQEYTGVLINFKTYSKSFKDKRRRENPEENQRVFENHHEPIIDRSTWETVQKIRAGTKRRQPKNSEKNMFAGLLYCADCGHKLHYNINHPNSAIEYFNCSNYRGNRGTCNETHYVRADSLEQVVLLELNRMVSYLQENEEEFAELLARKTSQDYEREKRFRQQKLAELNARYSEVDMLFERTYEDNVSGKLSDERFMKLSQRYDEEQQSLKKEIAELESICDKEDSRVYSKNQFLKAVRKFMQMKTLTPTMLHELVERIDVYHIQGTGKNRTQRLVIHYKFVGVLDLPHSPVLPGNVVLNSRQGVEIEYLVGKAG